MNYDDAGSEQDDLEVAKANKYLKEFLLPAFLKNLEDLNEIPIDSISLTQVPLQIIQYFHSEGINMRYLGWVASNTNYADIKNICQNEMIARACKKILRQHMSEFILNQK